MTFEGKRVVLASASPRRHELLKQILPEFEIMPADLDEDSLTEPDPFRTAEKLAQAKAMAVHTRLQDANCIVIGSDTVVALPDPILGSENWLQLSKPTDPAHAIEMLMTLQGKEHWVITGVAVVTCGTVASGMVASGTVAREVVVIGHESTRVKFHSVSLEAVERYVETGEPMDKAGAYGAQGMGSFLVESLNGGFDTVVGLPVELTRKLLLESL